jgi:hypothetical protein
MENIQKLDNYLLGSSFRQVMTIQQSDIKILWAKAAGRCSMQDCRKTLVAESGTHVSGNVLFGENCHIVGESEDGPRGNSTLSTTERNRYPNLILLCRNHHGIIDKDPKSWPIERLHQIKSDHEIWVETQLTLGSPSINDQIYSSIANLAADSLMLSRWDAITDHAITGLVFDKFIDGAVNFYVTIYRTNWPGTKPQIEKHSQNLGNRLQSYIEHYRSLAFTPDGVCWQEDKRWKAVWRSDYDEHQDRSEKWSSECIRLLFNLCLALNEFASAIRSDLNPNYFAMQGRFLIYDSLGVTNNLQEAWYDPSSYK